MMPTNFGVDDSPMIVVSSPRYFQGYISARSATSVHRIFASMRAFGFEKFA
jgi:hypothetical protein